MTSYYLVLIETSGNQNFIFSTNKLKENIGASELTYQAGTKWILEAVAKPNDVTSLGVWSDSSRLRKLLRDPQINPPIESEKKSIEILTAASGKALLLARDKETAKQIISDVTKKALEEAPGLDIAGVHIEIENWNFPNTLHKAVKEVHKKYEKVRSRRPSPLNRFLRLPIIADCAVSELPASELESLTQDQRREGKQPKAISVVSSIKRDAAQKAVTRLTKLDERLQASIDRLLKDEDNDSERKSWLAIVHADGNGLGQIFLNFEDYLGEHKDNRNYVNKYREFSLALDECTEAAFKKALDVFPSERNKENVAPIVPLIIGGDDLTVVCDGHYALEFTKVFLQEFERETAEKSGIAAIAKKAFGVRKLSTCAGIAMIKPHFPFSVAYDLAEDLIKSAKNVKRKITKNGDQNTPFPCSAIDFHILYDTSGIDLSAIQKKLKPEEKTLLYNRPYIVTNPEENLINPPDPSKGDTGIRWIEQRRWEVLEKWVNLVKQLPSSQSHALRTALFLGKEAAEAQCKLIESRYDYLKNFLQENSLFMLQRIKDKQDNVEDFQVTSFLDALGVMDFLNNAQNQNSGENE